MSYPAILSPLVSVPTAPRGTRRALLRRAPGVARPIESGSGGLRLFDAMKLLVSDLLHAGACDWIEPYKACRWCAARARWCAEGEAAAALTQCPEDLAARSARSGGLALPPSLRIGRRADPYPAAEASAGATRRLLESLADLREGLEVSIVTRSPLLLRDLDLLVDLDQKHGVSVGVVIPAVDPFVVRRIEAHLPASPASPSAAERFELVRALASHGIATSVLCTPIVPGVNNNVPGLRRLLALAGRAGAADVTSAPRHPALPPTPFEAEHLLPIFQQLRFQEGFPRAAAGRG
jgi:hypothetical protein